MISLEYMQEIENGGYSEEWKTYLAAKHYISAGIYVLPIVPNGKSLPEKKYNINYGSASRKMETIEKWFNPDSGKFRGWNIGIACGREGGVFAVDTDVSDEVNGIDVYYDLLGGEDAVPVGPVQATPSGGRHFIYQWAENAVPSSKKVGNGIDTRGGDANSCKSHIVVYPSRIKGKRYYWIKGGEIPEIPRPVMESLGVPWKSPTKGTGRGNEGVTPSDYEAKVPLDQLRRMLDKIDIEKLSYDQWLRVGQAINTQYPDADGFDLWKEWSRSGSRYRDGECEVRWKGFTPDGPVRVGTLAYYAKKEGWEPQEGDVATDRFGQIVEEMNQRFAVAVVGGKIRIIVEHKDDGRRLPGESKYDLWDRDAFKTWAGNMTPIMVNTPKGQKPVPPADIWLGHPARRTYERGLALMPDGDRPGYYNTWEGFAVEPKPGNCSKFLEHLHNVICAGNDYHYHWLLDWMADAVQDPANPKGTAVIIKGHEGSGKGIFVNNFGYLFGPHYSHLIDDEKLLNKFNAHLANAIVVFADEIIWGGNKKTAGKLKGLVSERENQLERKGIDAVSMRNMIHLLVASNEDWFIPAGPQSRRWFVLETDNSKCGDNSYFMSILKELENGGREALLHFLLNRRITNHLNRAPETDQLRVQRSMMAGGDATNKWWAEVLSCQGFQDVYDESGDESVKDTDWPRLVNRQLVYREFAAWCQANRMSVPLVNNFYEKMESFGAEVVRPRIPGTNRRPYMFQLPDIEFAAEKFLQQTGIKIEV